MEVTKILKEKGVVGAGGAGFPTYAKLKKEGILSYIVNGIECEPLLWVTKEILKRFPRVKSGEIDGEKHPDICAEFNVFSLPLLILYVDEKESIRIGRNIDLLSLERNIERYYNMIYEK
ncbi:MAG: hypothetical protein PWP67_2767 [Clostridium butyricum]|nr:hypothetical protein [Clostridium butyricum]